MAKLLKLRRGSTSDHNGFTGAEGEVTVDTTKDTLVVHDGTTATGHTLLREDMSNLPAGTIDNADVNASAAIQGTKISPNFGSQNIVTTGTISGTLVSGVTATTQSASDNSTKVATTAYTTTAIANLVDSAPGALNTLNELAAALGDDSNFSTTVTNSLATKLATNGNGSNVTNLNASNISSGTINDARLPATISSDITGNAASADTVDVAGEGNVSGARYLVFTDNNGSGRTLGLDGSLSYAANTNTLTAGTFAGSGASLTGLNAGNISSGTISASRIPTLNQNTTGSSGSCTGNAATATQLATARTISGASFNGTANITLNNSNITNGAGYTTYSSNQATNTNSNVTFGTVNCSSLTSSGNVTAYSDATLKKEVSTINDALGIVGKLRGVTYKWISNEQEDIGVIAQEVEAVVPEVIKETEDGIKTVDYGRLVSVLINAVNELKAEVDALKGGS